MRETGGRWAVKWMAAVWREGEGERAAVDEAERRSGGEERRDLLRLLAQVGEDLCVEADPLDRPLVERDGLIGALK